MSNMILTDQQIAPIDTKSRKNADFNAGDTVRIHQKIQEKDKVRTQVFEGVVLARKHGTEPGATFTVRRVGTDGIAVEKIFPLYTPLIERIEVTRKAKTRRSKIYFLRERTPRQVREKLRKALDAVKDIVMDEPEEKSSQKASPNRETEKPPEKKAGEKSEEGAKVQQEESQEKTEDKEKQQEKTKKETQGSTDQEQKNSAAS